MKNYVKKITRFSAMWMVTMFWGAEYFEIVHA